MKGTSGIWRCRENVIQFYRKQEFWLAPAFRFAVSCALLFLLRGHLGAHGPAGAALQGALPNVILALLCSMLPAGYTFAVAALVTVWDLYQLSLEATAIFAALLLLCVLVYFRFSPRDAMVLLAMPIAYALGLHYAVPLVAGLLFGPGAAVPVVFGLLFTRYVLLVEDKLPEIGGRAQGAALAGEQLIANFRTVADGLMGDKGLLLLALALAATTVIVYLLRQLVVPHAWTIAITAGCIIELAILLVGEMRYGTQIDLAGVYLGIAASFAIAQAIRFFLYRADFLRVETIRFEDEDYYYYVKAIPKAVDIPEEEEE